MSLTVRMRSSSGGSLSTGEVWDRRGAVAVMCCLLLSVTYHTEILQNKIMQTEAELQPFNVHTLVMHLVNVFSLTQMYD